MPTWQSSLRWLLEHSYSKRQEHSLSACESHLTLSEICIASPLSILGRPREWEMLVPRDLAQHLHFESSLLKFSPQMLPPTPESLWLPTFQPRSGRGDFLFVPGFIFFRSVTYTISKDFAFLDPLTFIETRNPMSVSPGWKSCAL